MDGNAISVRAEFPPKLDFLFQPKRYKVLHGGRGGAKSWGVARALLIMGAQKPLRILCARELQVSIKDSVHKLLSDQIKALGLEHFYEVQAAVIKGANGTEFAFKGLRTNAAELKSFESADICWVEEARNVSKASWNILIPTIRKEGSEIWVTFNPELDNDETYLRFVVNPPSNCEGRQLNYEDNPWFPDVLRQEMEDLKARDFDSYLVVWRGQCRHTLDGAIYAKELRTAMDEGRITNVPYDRGNPVHTAWDLGWADNTSIWFFQRIGFELRVIDHLSANKLALADYLRLLQNKGYVYGTDWLPHDADSKDMRHGLSVKEMMQRAGRTVQVVPRLPIADGLNSVRTAFPNIWIDKEKCADGLQSMRRYRWATDDDGHSKGREPLHDINSHDADAFRTMVVGISRQPRLARAIPAAPTRKRVWGSAGLAA